MKRNVVLPTKSIKSALAHALVIALVVGIAGFAVRTLVGPASTSERSAAESSSRGIGETQPSAPAEVPRPGPQTAAESGTGDKAGAEGTAGAESTGGAENTGSGDEPAVTVAERIAAEAVALPSRIGLPASDEGPIPVGLDYESVRASGEVISVGVDEAGEFDVPPASQIGWYRFGPTPGEQGSAVLAAHIAFNGRDGVFRYLSEAEIGERFSVLYSDGSEREFVVTEVAQYNKEELPFDRVFAREGDPELALITCGGAFDSVASTYEDNFVVYAEPVR